MAETESNSPVDTFLTRAKTIIEIIAIPVAVYWAFTHFEQGEAPSFKIRPDLQSELSWFDSTDRGECFGKLGIRLKNIGKVNFEVEKVTLRAWVAAPHSESKPVSYFSPTALNQGAPLEEKVTADQLVGEYRPDQTSYEDFTFRFKRRPGYFALIEVEAALKPTKYER